jgi:hypothetical protein
VRDGRHGVTDPRTSTVVEEQDEDEEPVPLEEDIEPEDKPVYTIEPLNRWHPDRVRMFMALGSLALLALMYIGMFVLITSDATDQQLLVWGGATGAVNTLAAGIVTYFFTTREGSRNRAS